MRVLLSFSFFIIFSIPLLSSAQESLVTETSDVYAGGPAAPVVTSDTFTDPDAWYQPQDVTFSWNMPGDITAVAAELFAVPGKEPQTTYRPAISELELSKDELTSGTHYLSVQFRNNEKWGEFTVVPIKIDRVAPVPFTISASLLNSGRPAWVLSWQAEDAHSGIDHYTVEVNGHAPEVLSPSEARSGYLLDVDATSQYELVVTAFDMAGNERVEKTLLLPTTPVVAGAADPLSKVANEAGSVLLAVMSAVMLLMFGYLVFERQRYAHKLNHLKKETEDIHSQLLRIFTALREEIHDQIRGITKKKKLNKGEQEAVEGLNKALSVSEMLLEREVQDVKKLAED